MKQDSEIVQNEVFGPVVTVQSFGSDDDAIAMANGVRYGLAASVFCRTSAARCPPPASSTSAPSG